MAIQVCLMLVANFGVIGLKFFEDKGRRALIFTMLNIFDRATSQRNWVVDELRSAPQLKQDGAAGDVIQRDTERAALRH
jgi:hypothetical protein